MVWQGLARGRVAAVAAPPKDKLAPRVDARAPLGMGALAKGPTQCP
jgi:hypothetical protein